MLITGPDSYRDGHSHEMVLDFKIGKTTVTTNQLGYVEYGEHLKFRSDLLIPTERHQDPG